jgi:hypothetical protein
MKLELPAGSNVAIVRITGERKSCEPAHVRIVFPGGDVEVVRAKDGEDADYWVHLRVNRPNDGHFIPEETDAARVIDARIDANETGTGSSLLEAKLFKNPNIYHVALRVKREQS